MAVIFQSMPVYIYICFAVSTEVIGTFLAFLQLCHTVEHNRAIQANVGTEI